MRTIKLALCLLLVLLGGFIPISHGSKALSANPLPFPVSHKIKIDLRILGLSNSSTITITAPSITENLPTTIAPLIESINENFGQSFRLDYTTTFFNETSPLNVDFRAFIQSHITDKRVPSYLQQFFPIQDNAIYATIPVQQLQSWLQSRDNQLGIADETYTLLVANLTGISNYDHYFESVSSQADSAFASARYSASSSYFPIVNWLTEWEYNRVLFIDLSAGSADPSRDYTLTGGFVPIQSFFSTYRDETEGTLTRYISDYISSAIRELVVQNYWTAPPVSDSYSINVVLFDDTGRIFPSTYQIFLNVSKIEEALQAILPTSRISTTVNFVEMKSHTADSILRKADLQASLITTTVKIGFGSTGLNTSEYDARQVHDYLEPRVSSYEGSNGTQITIFAFALPSDSRFVETFQEGINNPTLLNPDGDPRYASVFEFPDIALISQNERNLFDWGVSFTRPVIQAVGQLLGLSESVEMAPNGVMSRYGYDHQFTHLDKDAIGRTRADYFLSLDEGQLDQIGDFTITGFRDLTARGMVDNLTAIINLGDAHYDALQFDLALTAYKLAYTVLDILFTWHANWLQDMLANLGEGSTVPGSLLLRDARGALAEALAARASGNLIRSFHLLSYSTQSAAAASNIEETYASTKQNNLLLGVLFGFALGVGLVALAFGLSHHSKASSKTPKGK